LLNTYLFKVEPTGWLFLVGIVLALLPDIDALPEVFRYGQVGKSRADDSFAKEHRSYLHFPLLYLLVGIVIAIISPFWGALFLVATALHFLNDLYGTGWGVMLFWPFSKKRYKLFSKPVHDDGKHGQGLQSVVAAEEAEVSKAEAAWGDENWIDNSYLRLTWISAIEYSLFVLALILAAIVLL
jgi:hypothetical protein